MTNGTIEEQLEKQRQGVSSLSEVAEALNKLGIEAELNDEEDAVVAKIGGIEHPFPVVLTSETEDTHLIINCQVLKAGQIKEESFGEVCAMLLDMNTRINPFAYALITDQDDENQSNEAEWPIVLTDRIPFIDLSIDELNDSMESLRTALVTSVPVLRNAISG